MKLVGNTLFMEFSDMTAVGISEFSLKNAKRYSRANWSFISDPADRRKVLIDYEQLSGKYKQQILSHYGDPYLYLQNQVIKSLLKTDPAAHAWYVSYRTDAGKQLDPARATRYTTACSWLNMLAGLDKNWPACRQVTGAVNKPAFYEMVLRIIAAENVALPGSYENLLKKLRDYKKDGYAALVSRHIDNSNGQKVKDAVSLAFLLELVAHSNQFDDPEVSIAYNVFAKAKGYAEITPETVGNYRRRYDVEISTGRYGRDQWYNKHGKVTSRNRPTAPLMLLNHDDNDIDLYFIDGKNPYGRVVMYVVMDAYNDYPLGWAIDKKPTAELVRRAYLSAFHHVRELTGDSYAAHQVQGDRFAHKANAEFLSQVGIYTPTKAHNHRGKVIEQAFSHNWHDSLKLEAIPYGNYNGHNVRARSKANPDALQLNIKNFPLISQAPAIMARHIDNLRHSRDKNTGVTRQQAWLAAFEASKQVLLTADNRLLTHGFELKKPVRITNNGLVFQLNGERFSYDVPADMYLETTGMSAIVKYDPYDMNQVMAMSRDGRTRMVCNAQIKMPMALADYQPGDRQRLNSLMDEKKAHVRELTDRSDRRRKLLADVGEDPEAYLLAGVHNKELMYQATRALEANTRNDDGEDDGDQVQPWWSKA